MKKQIAIKLSIFTITALLIVIIFHSIYQINEAEVVQESVALSTIAQIEDVLLNNEVNLETLTESLQDEYIIKAQTTAYILEIHDISTEEEYQELANLLGVDEIHVFNDEGIIYEGSVSMYYDYSFDSGEQMSFFKPLLEDKSLTLCQDITPNTAESKYMMYIATWTSDGTDIVQIGLEPERILEEQSQNELSYIFANMLTTNDTILFAVDSETETIVGCTNESYVDSSLSDVGFEVTTMNFEGSKFDAIINDIDSLCVFQEYNGTYIGVSISTSAIYSETIHNILFIAIHFTLIALLLYCLLLKIIDVSILKNFDLLIKKVNKIAAGDLDTQVDIQTSPEFIKLSSQLNMMVSSLLNTTNKMSHVLDHVDTQIAAYEYKKDMRRVFATRKIQDLLGVEKDELSSLLSDKTSFEAKIQDIKKSTTKDENVYLLASGKFIRIETMSDAEGEHGVIIDVTTSITEKKRIERERDYDLLTDLYTRRALFRRMERLFNTPEKLKEAIIIALDGDNLKQVNDTFGHNGGDIAIKYSGQLLRDIPTKNKVVGRLGGDEFIAIIYGEDNKENLFKYVHDLRLTFDRASINMDDKSIPISMSAGYIFCSNYDMHYEELLKLADKALYTAKNNGKNIFVEYKE